MIVSPTESLTRARSPSRRAPATVRSMPISHRSNEEVQRRLATCVAGTTSSQTVCQMPVVRGYQMECGSSCQSCLPRGLATSCGSSCASTTSSCSNPSDGPPPSSASVTSSVNGRYPPSWLPRRDRLTQTVAS